jgi:hypothetical protein
MGRAAHYSNIPDRRKQEDKRVIYLKVSGQAWKNNKMVVDSGDKLGYSNARHMVVS